MKIKKIIIPTLFLIIGFLNIYFAIFEQKSMKDLIKIIPSGIVIIVCLNKLKKVLLIKNNSR